MRGQEMRNRNTRQVSTGGRFNSVPKKNKQELRKVDRILDAVDTGDLCGETHEKTGAICHLKTPHGLRHKGWIDEYQVITWPVITGVCGAIHPEYHVPCFILLKSHGSRHKALIKSTNKTVRWPVEEDND